MLLKLSEQKVDCCQIDDLDEMFVSLDERLKRLEETFGRGNYPAPNIKRIPPRRGGAR